MADQPTEKPEAVAPTEGKEAPAVESKTDQPEVGAEEGAKTEGKGCTWLNKRIEGDRL